MAWDFMTLLQRDHDDLQRGLDEIAYSTANPAHLRNTLDGVRLGLTAHTEAEDIVLHGVLAKLAAPGLELAVAHGRSAHLTQEGALAALVCSRPGTGAWRDRAIHLRDLIYTHSNQVIAELVPVLRDSAPAVYSWLAGAFATERLRQLAMLQPSAPIQVHQLVAMS